MLVTWPIKGFSPHLTFTSCASVLKVGISMFIKVAPHRGHHVKMKKRRSSNGIRLLEFGRGISEDISTLCGGSRASCPLVGETGFISIPRPWRGPRLSSSQHTAQQTTGNCTNQADIKPHHHTIYYIVCRIHGAHLSFVFINRDRYITYVIKDVLTTAGLRSPNNINK